MRESDVIEKRSLKKARDALDNDPFFQSRRNKGLVKILEWLIEKKQRCEQQAFFSVDAGNPRGFEKIILQKIEAGSYV